MAQKPRFLSAGGFLLVALFSFLGCGGAKSQAETAARGFMQAYYVDADLNEASQFSDSLALDKVKTGETLRDGLSIDEAAHHPKVRFKLAESHAEADQAEFIYDVEFHPEMVEAFHKRTRVIVRLREGGQWKVTQFSDHDPL